MRRQPVFPKFEREPPDFVTERVLNSVTSAYSRKGHRMMLLPQDVAHEASTKAWIASSAYLYLRNLSCRHAR